MCGGAPRAVIPDGILKCRDPACTHPKTYLSKYILLDISPSLPTNLDPAGLTDLTDFKLQSNPPPLVPELQAILKHLHEATPMRGIMALS